MPNKNYVAGREREYRSMHLLREAGYEPHRAAGSKGVWDIIGIGPQGMVLIQVKYQKRPSAREYHAMVAYAAPPNAEKYVHLYRKGIVKPAVIPVAHTGGGLALGDQVAYMPDFPGKVYSPFPWQIVTISVTARLGRGAVTFYEIQPCTPQKGYWTQCLIRRAQLAPWDEAVHGVPDRLSAATAVYLETKNQKEHTHDSR